ncbi:hypothetical protein H4R33_005395 [Dimargaris cristalligena]|nr:hypothetical protein H4R33_005395 [Dimargaris cristalligena]
MSRVVDDVFAYQFTDIVQNDKSRDHILVSCSRAPCSVTVVPPGGLAATGPETATR